MSLIADALKRAQRGVAGRRPPLPVRPPPRSAGGLPAPVRRMLILVGTMAAVGGLLIWSVRFLIPVPKPAQLRTAAAPPLMVETPAPKAPERPKQSRPAKPAPRDNTTITDVLAALQLKPEDEPRARPSPSPPAAKPDPARGSDARREAALQRAKEALEGDRPPAVPPVAAKAPATPARAPVPEPSTAPPAKATPPPPPPTVEIHAGGKDAAGFFAEGVRHHREGRYPRAIEEYEKAIAADPGNLEAYNNLGVLFKETGRLDHAVSAFQRALALDPKYEKALNNLGVVRYLKGQYEEAISLFKQAIVINPENVESYTNLGIIYLLAERLVEASTAFERAFRLDPKHAETHYNLALLYERQGMWPKALSHYRRFMELAQPKHAALVAKVRERLRTLAERR